MVVPAYRLTTLDLFEDLKDTNIKNEDFKVILSSYNKLASEYIKNNQADLYKDLNKQKEILFSYLPTFKKESIRKVASLHKQLEAEMGNLDEIDTLQTPEKQVQFIKVAYNNGKWTIQARNFDNTEFSNKETPEAINCLVTLCDRLDEQEAAYALCHAKKAGLFTIAALPYVRTEDFNNTALETRYIKDPGTTLGPVEHSWESSVDNTNMPVSRQIASEDLVQEMDTFEDQDGDRITISSVSGDAVITFDNDIYTKEEVEENINSGHWTKVEAADENAKVLRLKKQAEPIAEKLKRKAVINEAIQRVAAETISKLEEAKKSELEQLEQLAIKSEPKLRKIAAKIDSITLEDDKAGRKCQKLVEHLDESGMTLNYSREVPVYQKRTVSVKEAEEVIEKLRVYVSPKNMAEFNEIAEELFTFNSKLESFSVTLTNKDPRNEELVQDEMEALRKIIKTSQNDAFVKDETYNQLDKLLIAGDINFDQYNTLSDYAEMDSKSVLASIKKIQAGLNKDIKADVVSNIANKVKEAFNTAKGWIMDKLSFLSLQEKEIKDINEEFDRVLDELNHII